MIFIIDPMHHQMSFQKTDPSKGTVKFFNEENKDIFKISSIKLYKKFQVLIKTIFFLNNCKFCKKKYMYIKRNIIQFIVYM